MLSVNPPPMKRLIPYFLVLLLHSSSQASLVFQNMSNEPIKLKLTDEQREALRCSFYLGRKASPIMEKAWETNEYGFITGDLNFNYGQWVKEQKAAGVDLDAVDQNGRTALMHAAVSLPTLELPLLTNGANLSVKDNDGRTAADYSLLASIHGSKTNLYYAEKYMSYQGQYLGEVIWGLFKKRDFAGLEKIFKLGHFVDLFDFNLGHSLLTWAIRNKDLEMARFLLDQGADPNFGSRKEGRNNAPIMMAVEKDYVEGLELLLSRGAKLDAAGFSSYDINPVRAAAWKANIPMLRLLLAKGALPDVHVERLVPHQQETIAGLIKHRYWDEVPTQQRIKSVFDEFHIAIDRLNKSSPD